jgi:hypothetical protein
MLSYAHDVYPSFAALEVLARQQRCQWNINEGGAVRYHIQGTWSQVPKVPPDSEMQTFTYGAARLILTAPPGDPVLAR